jgi:predicted nucleotidyltransferase
MLAPIITKNINKIKALCEQHKVKELYVFGSAVTDNFNKKSDVDLLYKFDSKKIGDYFINFFEFKEKVEKILKRKVDLVPYENLKNKYFIASVQESKVKLYEA